MITIPGPKGIPIIIPTAAVKPAEPASVPYSEANARNDAAAESVFWSGVGIAFAVIVAGVLILRRMK